MGHPRPLSSFVLVFSKKHHYNFYNKYTWKMPIHYMELGFKPTTFITWVSPIATTAGLLPICRWIENKKEIWPPPRQAKFCKIHVPCQSTSLGLLITSDQARIRSREMRYEVPKSSRWVYAIQCDQIGRLIALWATFQSLW